MVTNHPGLLGTEGFSAIQVLQGENWDDWSPTTSLPFNPNGQLLLAPSNTHTPTYTHNFFFFS